MGILDDTAIFVAVVQQGGFSHAARQLGLSNGLVSRRIAQLEADLGVTLIKRTTRQLHLTPEGELFWQHAQRIQQELDAAVSLIQSSASKPKGTIRISAPPYFGRHYLTPILIKFSKDFPDIHIDLVLSHKKLDPMKTKLDLVIRGAGYSEVTALQDSNMQMKLLLTEKIGLYASHDYVAKYGKPKDVEALSQHAIIHTMQNNMIADDEVWHYSDDGKKKFVKIKAKLNVNDIESCLIACITGYGIGKFTELNVKHALQQQQLCPVLTQYDWGNYHLYAIYPQQQQLPKRTRLLLDFIYAHTHNFLAQGLKSI